MELERFFILEEIKSGVITKETPAFKGKQD